MCWCSAPARPAASSPPGCRRKRHPGGADRGRPAAWRDPWIRIPAGFARLYASGKYDWRFHTEAEPGLDGRSIHWPRGKVVGGSGAVNGLVFLRGSPRDYDRWAQSGARGWAYDDVLPYFRRMETWSGEPSEERGTDGPIHAAEARHTSPGAEAFIAARWPWASSG